MSAFVSFLVVGFLALWLAMTVGLQLPKVRPWLRSKDWAVVVPEYRFFAPTPARGDFHLVFRDYFADGQTTEWTELLTIGPRHLHHVVWNPSKRERKALFDAVVQILDAKPKNPAMLAVTVPYLLLLDHVSSIARTVHPTATQFAVMHSDGWFGEQAPEALLVSGMHKL